MALEGFSLQKVHFYGSLSRRRLKVKSHNGYSTLDPLLDDTGKTWNGDGMVLPPPPSELDCLASRAYAVLKWVATWKEQKNVTIIMDETSLAIF